MNNYTIKDVLHWCKCMMTSTSGIQDWIDKWAKSLDVSLEYILDIELVGSDKHTPFDAQQALTLAHQSIIMHAWEKYKDTEYGSRLFAQLFGDTNEL